MSPLAIVLLSGACVLAAAVAMVAREARRRSLHLWLGSHVRQAALRRLSHGNRSSGPVHVMICIADHYEPCWGEPSGATADARVAAWRDGYPRALGGFRDSDGRPPRHTFFYPIDQYVPRHVNALADLCRGGYGEVEIHLHHDNDNAENLERTLRRFASLFAGVHGLLGTWPDGSPAYGFVHGNWALDNSRPDGRWCGVANELDVLRRTGCYADFTLPSAPDPTQTRKINSIYYAKGGLHRCKSHDRGTDVGAKSEGKPGSAGPTDGLMLIQGPLRLWWPNGSWKPRIENGCLQRGQPPTMERLEQWLRAGVRVASRPDWVFVKLHTHGAVERNRDVLLGQPGADFHRELARRAASDPRFRFHYVTAREMFNLAKAAEAGWSGPVAAALDFVVAPPRPDNSKAPDRPAEESASTELPAGFAR